MNVRPSDLRLMCKATDAARRPAEITKSGHGGKMHFFAFEVIVRKDPRVINLAIDQKLKVPAF